MPPKPPQTIHTDRLRIAGPWAAWTVMVAIIGSGVWHVAGVKAGIDRVADGVNSLRAEVQEIRKEMREARETMHAHDVRISTLEEWKRSKVSAEKQQRPTAN